MQSGILRSVIDRRYPIHNTSDAIRYIEQGHAHGKVLIDVFGSTELI
jgi:NADPH:quinone reductase-like Zn-dependent oxidoreductase